MVRKRKAEGQADGNNKQKYAFKMEEHINESKKKSRLNLKYKAIKIYI